MESGSRADGARMNERASPTCRPTPGPAHLLVAVPRTDQAMEEVEAELRAFEQAAFDALSAGREDGTPQAKGKRMCGTSRSTV